MFITLLHGGSKCNFEPTFNTKVKTKIFPAYRQTGFGYFLKQEKKIKNVLGTHIWRLINYEKY